MPAETHRHVKMKRDTKRWCRGKAGYEHTPGTVEVRSPRGALERTERYCKGCGITLDSWSTHLGTEKPVWMLVHEMKQEKNDNA